MDFDDSKEMQMIVAGMISIKRRLYIQSINAKSDQDWYERGIEPLNISKRRNIKDYANSKSEIKRYKPIWLLKIPLIIYWDSFRKFYEPPI